jgi:hypothetical protein
VGCTEPFNHVIPVFESVVLSESVLVEVRSKFHAIQSEAIVLNNNRLNRRYLRLKNLGLRASVRLSRPLANINDVARIDLPLGLWPDRVSLLAGLNERDEPGLKHSYVTFHLYLLPKLIPIRVTFG